MSGIGPGAGGILALIVTLSLVGLFGSGNFVERCLFRPYWYLRNREYPTALLAGFVHADLPHLLFNSVTLWFFGIPLDEPRSLFIANTGVFTSVADVDQLAEAIEEAGTSGA